MGRTERQRKVIQMIVDKAKSAGLSTIFKIMDDVFPMVTTSMDKTEILQMLPTLVGYSVNDTTGFPSSFKFSNVKGSVIVPTSLESNVIELHKFLYGDEAYTPSATVLANSQRILEIAGGEASLEDTQKVTEENTANDNVIFENNGTSWKKQPEVTTAVIIQIPPAAETAELPEEMIIPVAETVEVPEEMTTPVAETAEVRRR